MNTLPPWLLMWILAWLVWVACKLATLAARHARPLRVNGRLVAYLFAWPGMNAGSFLDPRATVPASAGAEWQAAGVKLLLGIVLTWGVVPCLAPSRPLLAAWTSMVGLSFCLHFGAFHLMSLALRARGVVAPVLMDRPHRATSLAEFWGRRWNTAFHELATHFVFRPLRPRLGARGAFLLTFVASGLVHELVITVPAGGDFGGPTAYFLLQGLGILLERTPPARRLGLGRGWRGWVFAMALVVAPLGWLFPAAFIERVLLPFLHVIQAL